MANARHRLWHRAGPAAALTVGFLLIAAAAPGCDDGNETTSTGGDGGTAGSSTGGGGAGGDGGTGGMAACETPTGLTKAADAFAPLDSTPDSLAKFIYFTAHNGFSNGEGDAGVYGVDWCDGTVFPVAVGGRLAAPVGISISTDDKTLYVADAAYDVTEDDADSARGAIHTMNAGPDSTPGVLAGTEGLRPRGVDVMEGANGDVVYFTGVDAATGDAGVFSVPGGGGTASKVAVGAPFTDPSGVAVGKDRIFVTDTLAADQRFASVLVIENNVATTFLPQVRVGYPAGVALSMDEATLYVSGIDPVTESDVVLIIDVATKAITTYTDATLEKNTDAGGLHRARKTDLFSWSDLTAAGANGGSVYKVSFK